MDLPRTSIDYSQMPHDNTMASSTLLADDDHPLSNSFILLSSATNSALEENRNYRERWSWVKYLCWMIPIVWTSLVYMVQVIVGLGNSVSTEYYILAIYNIVAGVLGLSIVVIQVWDNWFYIKPSSWITAKDLEQEVKSLFRSWGVFILTSLLDTTLFLWTIFGSLWTLQLYGQSIIYQPALMTFAIINIIFQWSKYGLLIFTMKLALSSRMVWSMLKFVHV